MNTDEKILKLLESDSQEGARALVEKYLPIVRNVCSQKLSNREDISECVNDVFAEFCLNYQRYDKEKSNLKNYLCTIAERRAIDKYRKNCRKEKMESEVLENYKEELVVKENLDDMVERLNEAMEQLDPLDRMILEKYHYEGAGYGEIAKELHMNYEVVKKRGSRGRKKLLYLILVSILVLAITACTTVVMKSQGLLPLWFPFYDWIPVLEKEEKTENTENEDNMLYPDSLEKTGELEEERIFSEQEEKEDVITKEVKKYQVTDSHGLVWSDEDAYEMAGNEQTLQNGEIIYELRNVFYQNGKWEIELKLTCTDPEKMSYEKYDQSGIDMEEWVKEELEQRKCRWTYAEEIYLEEAYLLLGNEKRCDLEYQGSENIPSENGETYIFSFITQEEWDMNDRESAIALVLPDGKSFEIAMEKVEIKEFESGEGEEITEGIVLRTGVTELKSGQAIVGLCQENIEDCKIASMITQDYFGPIGIERKNPVLIDESSNEYERMRINHQDVEGDRMFEIYFQNVEPGEYRLNIPYLCLQKEMTTEEIKLPLPVGENERIECDIPVLFSDGTGFRIQKIIRHEMTGEIYYVDDGVLTKEEYKYWTYELEYETESKENYVFNVARARGVTANGAEVVSEINQIENEMKYMLKTNSEELSDSMTVEFYEPLYIWQQELFFDISLQE